MAFTIPNQKSTRSIRVHNHHQSGSRSSTLLVEGGGGNIPMGIANSHRLYYYSLKYNNNHNNNNYNNYHNNNNNNNNNNNDWMEQKQPNVNQYTDDGTVQVWNMAATNNNNYNNNYNNNNNNNNDDNDNQDNDDKQDNDKQDNDNDNDTEVIIMAKQQAKQWKEKAQQLRQEAQELQVLYAKEQLKKLQYQLEQERSKKNQSSSTRSNSNTLDNIQARMARFSNFLNTPTTTSTSTTTMSTADADAATDDTATTTTTTRTESSSSSTKKKKRMENLWRNNQKWLQELGVFDGFDNDNDNNNDDDEDDDDEDEEFVGTLTEEETQVLEECLELSSFIRASVQLAAMMIMEEKETKAMNQQPQPQPQKQEGILVLDSPTTTSTTTTIMETNTTTGATASKSIQSYTGLLKEFLDLLEDIDQDYVNAKQGNITRDSLDFLVGLYTTTKPFWFDPEQGMDGFKEEVLQPNIQQVVQELVELDQELSKDSNYIAKLDLFSNYYPDKMTDGTGAKFHDSSLAEAFVEQVVLVEPISTMYFDLKARNPRKMGPSCYLIEGTVRNDCMAISGSSSGSGSSSSSSSGDALIQALDQQLIQAGLQDNITCYYIIDPTSYEDMDIVDMADMVFSQRLENNDNDNDNDNDKNDFTILIDNLKETILLETSFPRALLLTPANFKFQPETRTAVTVAINTILAVMVLAYAAGTYNTNTPSAVTMMMMMTDIKDTAAGPVTTILQGFQSPMLYGLLGIFTIHELGHRLVAWNKKIQMSLVPTIIPSPWTGILATHALLYSPPKNKNDLFDFAFAGPFFGMLSSLVILIVGIQQTLVDASSSAGVASLPHVPLEFLKLGSITTACIGSIMGMDVLLSLDPTSATVPVHPLVIAGHLGILVNALNVLPLDKNSDGSRMLQSFEGTNALLKLSPSLIFWYLMIQGIREWGIDGLLLLYVFYSAMNDNPEYPCRNNVDPATSGLRLTLYLVTLFVSLVALTPAF